MAIIRCVSAMQGVSGIPADRYENVFHVTSGPTAFTGAMADTVTAAWQSIFKDGATNVLNDFLSDAIERGTDQAELSFYPIAGGSPLFTRSWTVGAIGSVQSVPHEVAFVVSFSDDLTGVPETAVNPTPPPAIIRPAARLRNRMFMGPLNVGALGADSGGDVVPHASFLAAIEQGFGNFNDAIGAAAGASVEWCGYSPTDATDFTVVNVWYDNAFDTQRRRGSEPTSRTVFIP